MPLAKIGLAEHLPRIIRYDDPSQDRVMRKDQLPIATSTDIHLDRVGYLRSRQEPGQRVVRESSRPASMPHHFDRQTSPRVPKKTVYSRQHGRYRSCRKTTVPGNFHSDGTLVKEITK
jgi:hypothetical protein